MKEFEKRFNKEYPLSPTIERGPIGRDFKNGCEKMWRAALEEALKQLNDIYDSDFENSEIVKWIEGELES